MKNKINTKTKLFAVIGNPVGHSKSPLIHNIALQETGVNGVYLAFKVEKIEDAINAMRKMGFAGYSATIPHKIELIKYLDEIDPTAKKIGAVNTVHNNNGKLIGYNTDCNGAIDALKEKTNIANKKIYVLGAGGAARAIVAGLEREKTETTIFARRIKQAQKLANTFNAKAEQWEKIDSNFEILINTTPVGMHPNVENTPFPKELLRRETVVFDVIYNPLETKLISEAKALGCKVIPGIEMFLGQAFEQFRIWNNLEPPKEKMRKALISELKKESPSESANKVVEKYFAFTK